MNPADYEKYDALIFDCDGTLADSMPIHFVAWRDTLQQHGISFAEDRFYSMGGMSSERIVNSLSQEQGVSLDAAEVAEQKEQAFRVRMHEVEPMHRVCEVARHFARRKPMAVASGSGRDIVRGQLQALGLEDLFGAIVTSEDTERHKPDPDVFQEAARRLGVDPAGCVVFEDSPLGFRAAESAGMDWVDVR